MKKPASRQIENAKAVLLAAGYVPYYWHIEDIKRRDSENNHDEPSDLTEEELFEIAQNVADNADANYGICWDSFDEEIETLQEGKGMKRMTEKQILKSPTHYPLKHADGTVDKRYSARLECDGSPAPLFVLRFCGEYVGSSISLSTILLRAVGHRAVMNGAEVITEVRNNK